MADDAAMDRDSSPDPLLEDVPPPSSMARPSTRRITKTLPLNDLSSLSLASSSARHSSSYQRSSSPRKQTFELDVGKSGSPQRILVTVEAEEDMAAGINRRLFAPSSPTRNVLQGEETMTTRVPLRGLTDDEGDADADETIMTTPRRRGRPRRVSNGTPMPKRRKRTGTPVQKPGPGRPRKQNEMGSEASMPGSDAFADMIEGDAGITPRPTKRARKTPRKAVLPGDVPSSQQPSSRQTTGRKRGRPRKAMMPEELAVLATSEDAVLGDRPDGPLAEDDPVDLILPSLESEAELPTSPLARGDSYKAEDDAELPPQSSGSATPRNRSYLQSFQSDEIPSQDAEVTPPQETVSRNMQDDPQEEEAQSEAPSNYGDAHHPSDFSMIGLESLPSFQASFQANASGISLAPPMEEMGEETSHIVNQSLAAFRQSTQTEANAESPAPADVASDDGYANATPISQIRSVVGRSSPNARSSSPMLSSRKPMRSLPLSRQIFAAKARQADDSFSSIPESVLQAATPARPSAKPRSEPQQHEDDGDYDDSFSEIPDDVLEAATPGPSARTAMLPDNDPPTRDEPAGLRQGSRDSSVSRASDRLPTPDDTSSSNLGSKRGHQEDPPMQKTYPSALPSSHQDMPSSPPQMAAPYEDRSDSQLQDIQSEGRGTPEPQPSSPRLPPSGVSHSDHGKSLEPPAPSRRPTLSPIVRVGRTLQSVLSDRSSPEGGGSSLGSPFRGSARGDSRQSSIAKSPVPHQGDATAQQTNGMSMFRPSASFAHSIGPQGNGRTQSPGDLFGHIEDAFGTGMRRNSQTELLRRSNYNGNSRSPHLDNSIPSKPVADSARPAPPTEDEMSWVADGPAQQVHVEQRTSALRDGSRNAGPFAAPGFVTNKAPLIDVTDLSDSRDEDQQDHPVQNGEMNEKEVDEPESDIGAPGAGFDAAADDFDDFGGDLWDIEASRPSPKAHTPVPPSDPPQSSSSLGPRRSKIPSPWRKNSRRLIYQDEVTSPSQIEVDDNPLSEEDDYDLILPRQRRAESEKESRRESSPQLPIEENPEVADRESSPEDDLPPPVEDDFDDDGGENETVGVDENEDQEDQYSMVPTSHSKPDVRMEDTSQSQDYSMVPHSISKNAVAEQDKPAAPSRSMFGGFNIMSFFSSPASLPKNGTSGTQQDGNTPRDTQKELSKIKFDKPIPQDPTNIWAQGLFPSIPEKEFRPSPERPSSLFSPGSALRSGGTVADTYAATSSPRPATPEIQVQAPVAEQKRNFTPRPGQSDASFFRPSQPSTPPSGTRSIPRVQVDEAGQDSSVLTEESEYERVPPREKPSRWDKTLSPSKSSFRSPLKPSTPGRVVTFNGSIPLLPQAGRHDPRNILPPGFDSPPRSNGRQNMFFTNNARSPQRQRRNSGVDPGVPIGLRPLVSPEKQALQLPVGRAPASPTPLDPNSPLRQQRQQLNRQSISRDGSAASVTSKKTTESAWTKRHWLQLDELLRLRRLDPVGFPLQCQLPPRSERAASAALVGKEVSSHGEKMLLESWHMDVVDAFVAWMGSSRPPSWNEKVLAKRVFALVASNERRKRASTSSAAAR